MYTGGWLLGLKSGRGQLEFGPRDGRLGVYVGTFRQVCKTNASCWHLVSHCRHGNTNLTGIFCAWMQLRDCEQGLIQGKGTMRYQPSGDVYVGSWLRGMRHGYGEYTW